jgi:hypothetical protein
LTEVLDAACHIMDSWEGRDIPCTAVQRISAFELRTSNDPDRNNFQGDAASIPTLSFPWDMR